MSVYDFEAETLDGKRVPLAQHRGEVLLIVNTASKCGFTPQYEGLEKLYRDYRDQGLVVLGVPCNQFAGQEPGTEAEMRHFGPGLPAFGPLSYAGSSTVSRRSPAT